METSTPYPVNKHPPADPRPAVLEQPYCQTVKEFMLAMITAEYPYESDEDLCNRAIALTETLINGVFEKL